MCNSRQRKADSARPHRLLNKAPVSTLLALLVAAAGLTLLGTTAAAQSAPSAPDLLWMNGGHAGGIGRAALSPDGQTLATLDYAEVYIWRYPDGRLLRTIGATWIGDLKCAKFTPDGQFVLASGTWIPGSPNVSTLRMWRVSDGNLVRDFAVTKDVRSFALSADGTQLAAAIGGADPNVTLFDVATGNAVRTLGLFAANAVAFSRDGFVAATGADQFGAPPSVNVWRASDGLMVAKLAGLSFISNVVAFSPDGRYLAAGDWGGNGLTPKVLVWLAPLFVPVQSLSPYAGSDGTIAFSPDSQSLATVTSPGGGVIVWHLPDGLPSGVVPVHTGQSTWNLIFSDGNTLFASGAQSVAGVWRVSDGTLTRTIGDERHFPSNSIAFSPDSAHLAVSNHYTGSFPGTWQVEVLRASDGAPEGLLATHDDIINSVAFSPDGTRIASASGSQPPDTQDARIFISPVSGGPPLILAGHPGGTTSVAFSPDGTLLASGGGDNAVRLWRASDGSVVRVMSGHTHVVSSVAFSPDGQTIASGSGDAKVKFWRVSDGALLRTIMPDGYPVGSVAYSPGGQALASSTYNGVQLFRASDGQFLRSMSVTAGVINVGGVAFSADGSVVSVANGSYPPRAWFWRVSDGALVKTYDLETGWVQPPSLAFSPDGTMLAIGRYDSHVEAARPPAASVTAYTPAYNGLTPLAAVPAAFTTQTALQRATATTPSSTPSPRRSRTGRRTRSPADSPGLTRS